MMIDAAVVENGQGLRIEIDTDIYPDTVIDKVLYWYSSEYVILRKRQSDSGIEVVTLRRKDTLTDFDWSAVISGMSDKLVDYKNRKIVHEETCHLRELFFAKAFANNDDFVEFDFKD